MKQKRPRFTCCRTVRVLAAVRQYGVCVCLCACASAWLIRSRENVHGATYNKRLIFLLSAARRSPFVRARTHANVRTCVRGWPVLHHEDSTCVCRMHVT